MTHFYNGYDTWFITFLCLCQYQKLNSECPECMRIGPLKRKEKHDEKEYGNN